VHARAAQNLKCNVVRLCRMKQNARKYGMSVLDYELQEDPHCGSRTFCKGVNTRKYIYFIHFSYDLDENLHQWCTTFLNCGPM
jgi:hypothetical protein